MKAKLIFFLLFVLGFQNLIAQCTVTITPSSDTTICYGNYLTLIASGDLDNSTWEWSPSIGLNKTDSNTVIASPTTTTTYSVTRTCSDTATATATITVNPLPISNAGADINICTGNTGTIGSSLTSGHTYLWSPTTGLSSSTSSNPDVTLTNTTSSPISTTYSVTTTHTASGCTSSGTVTVTVNLLPISNAGADINICTGNTGTIGSSLTSG